MIRISHKIGNAGGWFTGFPQKNTDFTASGM